MDTTKDQSISPAGFLVDQDLQDTPQDAPEEIESFEQEEQD